MRATKLGRTFSIGLLSMLVAGQVHAQTLESLARDNAELKARIEQLEAYMSNTPTHQTDTAAVASAVTEVEPEASDTFSVEFNHQLTYDMLDPLTNINSKQRLLLEARQSGQLHNNAFYVGGAVTAIADYQRSNTESKFGYLMRHPTANNQRTKTVSEAVLQSTQLSFTATMGDWITAYMEVLYNPEQSFGQGTNTALTRNLMQVRKGYVTLGNLDESPFYLSLGKMNTPFGLTDTVNPYTASTVWHAFGGLAYGAIASYSNDGLNINAMAVQGGSQFRAANTPVDDSAVPSKLNNFVFDLNYNFDIGSTDLMLGASYQKGSTYCQSFPVTHFSGCDEANAAYDVYAQLSGSNWMLQAEFAKTKDIWPGTFNPTIPQFSASKVNSWDLGGIYNSQLNGVPVDYSIDFSRFEAGPSGAPWEKQDQLVLGLAAYVTPTAKLFIELIHTEGYVPLNFVSGGNLGPGVTHSDSDAKSDILMIGVNAAF